MSGDTENNEIMDYFVELTTECGMEGERVDTVTIIEKDKKYKFPKDIGEKIGVKKKFYNNKRKAENYFNEVKTIADACYFFFNEDKEAFEDCVKNVIHKKYKNEKYE